MFVSFFGSCFQVFLSMIGVGLQRLILWGMPLIVGSLNENLSCQRKCLVIQKHYYLALGYHR